MSKTIEQLRAEASIIEEATRQGENTQLRVGGLFQDIIDFIAQIPISETILGPLLQALNNSGLINPGDGQTLTFSLMKDGWTFSDALTQFQLKLGQISSTVTSNYEAFIQTRDMLQREVAATDQRVRSYKTDYDNSQIEYATWKSQTDTSISQYAVAIDKVTGDIISISGRVDTAYDQLDFVTNNLEAADKALEKLFNLTGLDYEDPEEAYTASWLYKNRQGIYGAAATFDESGNIIQSSVLGADIRGIRAEVSNVDGRVSLISQTVDAISGSVRDVSGRCGALEVRANSIEGRLTTVEGKTGEMGLYIKKDELGRELINGHFNADIFDFHFTEGWAVYYGPTDDHKVMWLDTSGDLHITGTFYGQFPDGVEFGSLTNKRMWIEDTQTGARLVGKIGDNPVIRLGFDDWGTLGFSPSFRLLSEDTRSYVWASAVTGHSLINLRSADSTRMYDFSIEVSTSTGIRISASSWPTSSAGYGYVYVENGFLKVGQ